MDIVERSQKAQEAINRMIGENSILKVINENQSKEIERLRVKFWEIIKLNPFHNATPPIDKQYYAQIIIEMINVANAALKGGE